VLASGSALKLIVLLITHQNLQPLTHTLSIFYSALAHTELMVRIIPRNMFIEALFVITARCQPQAGTDAASAELIKLVKDDQADRSFMVNGAGSPTKDQLKDMATRDKSRFARTNKILDTAPKLSVEGLDAAALLMQHGSDLESFVRAHELSACASFMGKPSSLIAAAEDRYLMNLKRKQRFGAQFVGFGSASKLYETDEATPTAVTDSLRKLYFEPPLEISRKEGLAAAFKKATSEIIETMTHRMDPEWIKKNSDPVISAQLAQLPASKEGIKTVLDLYNINKLVSDADFYNAGRVLASSSRSEELLLANELATIAFKEGYRPARAVFESTWDRFEISIGHRARYARQIEPKAVRVVLEE